MKKILLIAVVLLFSNSICAQTITKVVPGFVLVEGPVKYEIGDKAKVYRSLDDIQIEVGIVEIKENQGNKYGCIIVSETSPIIAGDMIRIIKGDNFADVLRGDSQKNNNNLYLYLEKRKNPSLSLIFSLLFPGGGHFYNGNNAKGLVFLLTRIGVVAFIITVTDNVGSEDTGTKYPLYMAGLGLVLLDVSTAMVDSNKHNKKLKEKYNLTLSTSSKGFTLAYNF